MVERAGAELRIFRRGDIDAHDAPAFTRKLTRGVTPEEAGDAGEEDGFQNDE
jgi:hypothetical protein